MAAEASNVNGVYDTQYTQPAELAASTPSHQPAAQKADAQEIGWLFVEQYYTTLSKTPERIHLFYSKKSQFVTGVEAEKVHPAVGTHAISEKIKALEIQDCKVRVLNVDSQSSFDNIVVQVIGEMSNKSQPHHKFVQTFVLATQPNGYFVLNDIFRYLSNEEDEIVEEQPVEEVTQTTEPEPKHQQDPEPEPIAAPAVEAPLQGQAPEEAVTSEEAAVEVDQKLEEQEPVVPTVIEERENGVDEEPPSTSEPALAEATESVIEESIAIPQAEAPIDPEPTPTSESPKQADAPPARKTWASMVGSKTPAVPALPQSTATSQPKTQRTAPSGPNATTPAVATTQTPAPSAPVSAATAAAATATLATQSPQSNGWQTAESGKKAKGAQSKPEAPVHAYIKNVNEKVDARILREVLEKYGELKYFDVSRPRNCAFVEFATPEGYAAAVAANPHDIGGESISVEERHPRPRTAAQFNNQQPNFNRSGGNASRGRGGLQQGRTGSQGSNFSKDGRGGLQQRGGKPGNVTPKGRGQAPAA